MAMTMHSRSRTSKPSHILPMAQHKALTTLAAQSVLVNSLQLSQYPAAPIHFGGPVQTNSFAGLEKCQWRE